MSLSRLLGASTSREQVAHYLNLGPANYASACRLNAEFEGEAARSCADVVQQSGKTP